jgi:thiol-disulfide isomerase/thioredoxin
MGVDKYFAQAWVKLRGPPLRAHALWIARMLSLSIGPLTFAIDHLLLLAGLAVASLSGRWVARRMRGEAPEWFNPGLLGLLGARLGFVASYWPHYHEHPWRALDLRDGGWLLWPGLLGVLIGLAWQAARHPRRRLPLVAGMACGSLTWALASTLVLMDARGQEMPPVALSDADGQPSRLTDYRGQPLVVNLWATWCPPCRREMPVLLEAAQRFPGVRFLLVNQGESVAEVAHFLASQGMDARQVRFDRHSALLATVGSSALPTTLFYDAQGRLVASHLGELSRASLAHALEVFESAPATGPR